MKKICKRLIAGFCALMLVSGSVLVIDLRKTEAKTTTNVIFSEDFNSYSSTDAATNKTAMEAKGWNATSTTAAYNTGSAYSIPHNVNANLVLSKLEGANEWTDYAVEAKLKFETEPTTAGKTVTGVAGRVQDASGVKKGYDLVVYKTNLSHKGAFIRLRCDGTKLAEASVEELPAGTQFTLKLVFEGTVLTGYFNGEEVIKYDTANDATKYASGYAGLRRQDKTGYTTVFDDFQVYTETEEVLPSGTTINQLFTENFNSYNGGDVAGNKAAMEAKGWNATNTTAEYSTGMTYSVPHNINANLVLSNLEGANEWTDYVVEAQLKFETEPTTAGKTVTGIAGRVQDPSGVKKGYDLVVYKTNLSHKGAYIRLRCDGTMLAEATIETLPAGTTFTLKMEFNGTVITGYFNDEEVIKHDTVNDATKYASGYAGIRRQDKTGYTTVFDNFQVYTVTREVPPSGTTVNQIFAEKFDGYSSSDAASNQTAMVAKGWNATSATAGYNTGEAYSVPHNVNANLVLSELEGASEWTDYVVEAKLKFESEPTTAGKTVAGIAGRVQDSSGVKKGYDLVVYKTNLSHEGAYLRLRCDGTTLEEATIENLPVGTEFLLELEFNGTIIKGYLDGILMITHDISDDATKYTSGYAGIRRQDKTGYTTTFDNFIVSSMLDMEMPDEHFYYNAFSADTSLIAEGWNSDTVLRKQEGKLLLNAGESAYLSNVTRSERWMDYIVESDVTLVSGTASAGSAGLVLRATDTANTGYEFKMKYDNGTTSVVLCKKGAMSGAMRTSEATETVLGTYYISFDLDTSYRMTVGVCGNNIMCWFGETLVFDYIDTDNAYLRGYTGVCSSKDTEMSSMYDNYAVREYVEPETVYPEGYLYYNTFQTSKSLVSEGWRNEGTKTDGAYVLSGTAFNYLTNVEGSAEWTDYVVEADVMINDDGTLPQYASIVGRSTNIIYNGYEYRLMNDENGTYLWLYKRGTTDTTINGKTYKFQIAVIPGEYNHMKMVLNGPEIICYFNGVKYFHVEDKDPYLTGYTGVRSPAGTATQSYDNYAVREIRDTDLSEQSVLQKGEGEVWFYDDFTGEDTFTDRGWNTDNMEMHDGAVKVYSRFYVNGIEDCESWTDYEVSAIVRVDKKAGVIGDAINGMASICARTLSSNTGYEFGILTAENSTSFLRFHDRATDQKTDDKSFVITEGEHLLRMACIGNEIYCYYDNELVFLVQSNSCSAGYAGLRASGYNTYYKEFTVKEADLKNQLRPGTIHSPQTGDSNGWIVNVAKVTLVVSAMGMIATIVYKRKTEEESYHEKK